MNLDRKNLSVTLWCVTLLALIFLTTAPAVMAGNVCQPGDEPDVIVGSLHQLSKNGTVGDITAFSIGTTSCNVGTCWLNWFSGGSNQHPTIGQNMFRLKDGRFEQLGQAWLKHGFFALSGSLCSNQCQATSGTHLGVNCSDPYSAFLNGDQDGMGPKFEVNTTTGFHPHPVTNISQTGNAIFKRLQVHHDDLDPSLNAGAQYFVEGQYVAEDDAGAGNATNNNSYRRINVTGSNGNYNASLTGATERESPGIRAWSDVDPTVTEVIFDVHGDGRYHVAYKVTDLGAGMWNYEYAIQNLTSEQAAGSFSVEVPVGGVLTNIGFHDVDYHSGEPFDNTDWTHNGGAGGMLTWSNGTTFDDNPDANALRWGTLYNFRFDSDAPPSINPVTLTLWKPGIVSTVGKPIAGPLLCDNDGTCDPGENCARCPDDCANDVCDAGETPCNCPADCDLPSATELDCSDSIDNDCDGDLDCDDADCCLVGGCSQPDADTDGFVSCQDCNDGDIGAWSTPTEAINLLVTGNSGGLTEFTWDPPLDPGGNSVTYQVLRARSAENFLTSTSCLAPVVATDTNLEDGQDPLPGAGFYYLVRPTNTCPFGDGPLGNGVAGERDGRSCP